jgi:hypothetical protein
MQIYRHALLLVQNETDGLLLLEQAERLAKEMGTRITVGHLSADYRELDYTSDSLTKDRQSREVIDAKAMLAVWWSPAVLISKSGPSSAFIVSGTLRPLFSMKISIWSCWGIKTACSGFFPPFLSNSSITFLLMF